MGRLECCDRMGVVGGWVLCVGVVGVCCGLGRPVL